MWQHFHHQADIGIRGIGPTLDEAFAEAGVALFAVMCSIDKVEPSQCIEMQCDGCDNEILLADWLNRLIYEMDTRKMLFCKFDVHVDGQTLIGKAWGEPADPDKHEFAVEVKAATYMMLKVVQDQDKQWTAQCVVDV